MLIKITGSKASGERFESERDLDRVPTLGESIEHEGERYVVEARTVDNTGGAITGGACRLKPVAASPTGSQRCPTTGFYLGRVSQCTLNAGHLGPCQFR
jgi:hypothetical protein